MFVPFVQDPMFITAITKSINNSEAIMETIFLVLSDFPISS